MTQRPPGPPPGGDFGPPVEPGYRQPEYPHGYSTRPAREQLPPPVPYLPGKQPLPPRARPRRSSPVIAPFLALIGLVLVAAVSWWALTFLDATLDEAAAAAPSPGPTDASGIIADGTAAPDGPDATPTPELVEATNPPMVVNAPPGETAEVKGTILFTRGGDIWAASGTGPELRRLSDSDSTRSDSSPAWSPDGKQIFFIRTYKRETENSRPGGKYTLYPTDLMRMKADGADKRKVYDSLIQSPSGLWFSHVLQPSVSADGQTVAVVSDGPDGNGPVELHIVNSKSGRMSRVPVPADGDLGHNNPAFSADGKRIAYTYNNASGTDGVPRVGIHTCRSRSVCSQGKSKLLKPGYASPSWAPDGTWLAVETTAGNGRDVALVSARLGDVIVKLTQDGDSFAPVVSPAGDQVAYLRRDGTSIDVRVATLAFDDRGNPSLIDDRAVTSDGGIDGDSKPSWFIPQEQLPADGPGSDAADPSGQADDTDTADGGAPSASPDDASGEGAPAPPGS